MTDFNYAAGLIDGEGTIGLERIRAASLFRAPYVSVSSTTFELMCWLSNNFGGYTSTHKVYKETHKQSWLWKVRAHEQLFPLLEGITPLLKVPEKKYRAELILWEYRELTKRNGKYTADERKAKEYFEKRFFDPTLPFLFN